MLRSPRLGLRAQIVLALSLVFLLSFWLLGFATLQITRRNAVVERARAERLVGHALGVQLSAADARSDTALSGLCRSLAERTALSGLLLVRADGTCPRVRGTVASAAMTNEVKVRMIIAIDRLQVGRLIATRRQK